VTHRNPKTCADALDQGKIDFDQNGAVRILWAHNITIDGIAVDAGGAAPFNNPNVWGDGVTCNGQLYPLFHGNAGIAIYISGAVTIRRCEISNGYFGIAVKDRNQGGAFANFNPADLAKNNIVPLSGFGRVGNHIFERNRIHNNSWGFFSESDWDLGNTVRYNLIYENHHATAAAAAAVKALSSEGANQPGGAFMFKDVMLTPWAIYNNTFWHNNTIFAGGYRPGAQHLIFNNIFATPAEYWSANVAFPNSFMEMTPFFVNRMHNSLFAAQIDPPKLDSQKVQAQQYDQATQKQVVADSTPKFYRTLRIMNQMGEPAKADITINLTLNMSTGPVVVPQTLTGAILPGAQIISATDAFPASANVRWYEIKFKSTDPASPDFLSPDWDDPDVKKFVMNAGWPEAGIYNSDGQIADIGAIPSVSRHTADVIIRPLSPALLTGTNGILSFDLQSVNGDLSGLKVKHIALVRKLPVLLTGFGGATALVVPPSIPLTVADPSLKMGSNTLTIAGLPAQIDTSTYAFVEIIAEGTASNGKLATTNVGFIPYRKLDYKFLVEVLDVNTAAKISSVKVGETAGLRITPQSLNGQLFNNTVSPVEVHLASGSDLLTPPYPPATKIVVDQVVGVTTKQILFTKVPAGNIEYVAVSGIWKQGDKTVAFYGISQGVTILPGDPAKIAFQNPPSKITSPGAAPVIDPGTLYPVTVEVRDIFDNPVGGSATVTIKSNNPTIGDIDGPTTAVTDSNGVAKFNAKVTTGDLNQTFELEASIPNKPSDKADLKVGKARDRLWILYGDAAKYDANAELRGAAGQRLAVTIRAGKDPDTKLTDRQTDVVVTGSTGLAIYAGANDANPSSAFKLTNGEVVIYVTGLRAVDNGYLNVDPATTDNTILGGTRSKIYFTFTPGAVLSASFHADNGQAAVDRVEITFRADLKRAPDSIALSWPSAGANAKVEKTGITWNAASPRQVTVKLADPFPAGLSAGTGAGTVYIFDPATPEIPVQAMAFTGADSVGPLLDSGVVLEKLVTTGQDTLFIGFNEKIDGSRLTGQSLQLIKPGAAPIVLTILTAEEIPGKGWRITLNDLGAQAPAGGDSLKINASGPLTDAVGNHAHPLNRPIALKLKNKPRPALLTVRFDQPYEKVKSDPQSPDFVILSGNADSSWTPVMGSVAGRPAQDCHQLACGGPVQSVPGAGIDRPAITLETDRAVQYSVTIFDNLGEFVNGFTGEITNAQLGLDDRNLPVTGGSPLFTRGAQGKFTLKIGWNAKSTTGSRAATGVYIAKITAVSTAEDGDGKPTRLAQSQAVRFGLMRN
ncbi:MAG: hypothetical protein JF616_19985, partial [Fibrobacteres bacterium]|nr:hypothetical protein [Fibrobacterota bacterium]